MGRNTGKLLVLSVPCLATVGLLAYCLVASTWIELDQIALDAITHKYEHDFATYLNHSGRSAIVVGHSTTPPLTTSTTTTTSTSTTTTSQTVSAGGDSADYTDDDYDVSGGSGGGGSSGGDEHAKRKRRDGNSNLFNKKGAKVRMLGFLESHFSKCHVLF